MPDTIEVDLQENPDGEGFRARIIPANEDGIFTEWFHGITKWEALGKLCLALHEAELEGYAIP